MYDMYPEWGPFRSDDDCPAPVAQRPSANWTVPAWSGPAWSGPNWSGPNWSGPNWSGAVQESIDLRDGGGERPEQD